MVSLVRALGRVGEAVEADFQRFYGIDVAAGTTPWRRFAVLFRYLPDESMSHAVVHGWGFDRALAVATLERIDVVAGQLHYLREQFAAQGQRHPKRWPKWKPLRIGRPFDDEPPPVVPGRVSIAQFRDLSEKGVT